MKITIKNKVKSEDILFFCTILFMSAGTFGFLPLNLFQILIIILGIILVIKMTKDKKLFVPLRMLALFSYMLLVTLTGFTDFESYKGLAFLFIEGLVLYWYTQRNSDKEKIFQILYYVAVILAIYGIIQEIAFLMDIPEIYDISRYGFARNGNYVNKNGTMRVMSLFAEPAHLSGIFSVGLLIGLIGNHENYKFVSKFKTSGIFICALLTQSVVAYFSIMMVVIYYAFYYQKEILNKIKWVIIFIMAFAILIIINPVLNEMFQKLSTIINPSAIKGSDISGFAIISNLRIAGKKILDGYFWGTGYDSHRLTYEYYLNQLYSYVLVQINRADAASLYTRILSEFGIVGIVGYCVWLGRKLIIANLNKHIITQVFSILVIVAGMRSGAYTNPLIVTGVVILMQNKYMYKNIAFAETERKI